METGYLIEEGGIITRVAEGAITFADTAAQYAPVIGGTAADQVKQATAAVTTVLGFVKKPLYGTIEDGDTVSIITRGIITMNVVGTVAVNDSLQVDADVDCLDELNIAAGAADDIYQRVARVLEPVAGGVAPGTAAWVEIRIGA